MLGAQMRPPLRCHGIGPRGELQDPDGAWPVAYGIEAGGAVLVRPDGYVAWRSRTAAPDATAELRAVFDRLLARRTARRSAAA
jgi:hypothetical protein